MIIEYVIKRDGKKAEFDKVKIQSAINKAFLANGTGDANISKRLSEQVMQILESKFEDEIPSVEHIQDIVENVLILNNYVEISKSYIRYREKHKEIREKKTLDSIKEHRLRIRNHDNELEIFDPEKIKEYLKKIGEGLSKVDIKEIVDEVCKTIYNEITIKELYKAVLSAVNQRIEKHYNYSYFAARIILNQDYKDVLGVRIFSEDLKAKYKKGFKEYIKKGVDEELLNPKLLDFDLEKISEKIESDRDLNFFYLGLQTIHDRYLIRSRKNKEILELPQWLWMRVAMGMALKEKEREKYAIEFYDKLSRLLVVSSTPTLFNSGTIRSQMSSCYVNTVDDSIHGIFKNYSDCGHLSKWAGGIGTDWTPVRAKGAKIFGTNGESQGIIPFIKIYNDVALAVNQGGKRRGAMAAYLEIWHRDIEEFLELKKNTGDERRRAHDIHTACMVNDLFMKRVKEKGKWTLFSPDTVNGLNELYGKEFEEKYIEFESKDTYGKKTVDAVELWRKLLTMLYETGHPWIVFKEPINVRNPQDHKGIIRSSNLCTEITLNTSKEETAVCNLASLNLGRMIKDKKLNEELIKETVTTAMRMLDNVIDNNFYPIPEAENSNLKHRPVGLGLMGYQDALYQIGIDFDSDENLDFADNSMEMISYYSILASSNLAKERGSYESYKDSKWDRGILPDDTIDLLEKERGEKIEVSRETKMDWSTVRSNIKEHGMRNSNCMAIAPTATISNIAGTTPCVEPTYKNIYMKENLSGNFVVINRKLIDALEKEGLWNNEILTKIKINNGSIVEIDEIPAELRRMFKETFEIDSRWIINAAARRARWIDQSASTNLFIKTTSGKTISDLYMLAWRTGLKTTYYLRSLAASQVTKTVSLDTEKEVKVCSILDPDCESCQ